MMLRRMFLIIAFFICTPSSFAQVHFVHITDLHIFESPLKTQEAKNSLAYFDSAVKRINTMNSHSHLDFMY
jgi:hypothetical protein